MTRPISAIVVAYGAPGPLARYLAALEGAVAVTVVDNSSAQEVRDVAERAGAVYVDPGANLGFGAGVNVALRALPAEERDVLLLNPDAALQPCDLEALARFLHGPAGARVGCTSPRLVGEDGTEQRVVWPFPTPGGAWLRAIGLEPRNGGRFVVGSVLLLRWEALRDVGHFDERFFLYAEETDWQRRAAERGWTAALCPDAVAVHAGGGTSGDERRRELLFHAAHETYIRKWHGATGWTAFRVATLVGAMGRAAVLRGERRAHAARRAVLYARGPQRSLAADGS